MKKIVFTILSLVLGAGILFSIVPNALAYRGDPNIYGPNYSAERHEEMEKIFENKDYNAWKNLMQGRGRVTQVVNAQNFNRFAQMHQLMEAGKVNEANVIRAELGLGVHNGSGSGVRTGMNRNWNR